MHHIQGRMWCMKKVLALLLLSSTAIAAEPQLQPIPPGSSRITVIYKGEPAPYDGQLFNNDTALRWANWLRQMKMVYRIDMEAKDRECRANSTFETQRYRLQQEQYNRVVAEYSSRLQELEEKTRNPPWHSTVWFGTAVGSTATVGVLVFSIWAVGQIK
jgi:hypothetical protein